MEGVSRRYPLYLSGEPGTGQHFLVVVDLLHGIPMRTIVNMFLRGVIVRGVGFVLLSTHIRQKFDMDYPKNLYS
jgi:hypothetical protein